METASLKMPSPKTKLNSFGYFLGVRSETAAITSVEQSRELIKRISIVERVTVDRILEKDKNWSH